MNEEMKQETQEKKPAEENLSRKRRTALVGYMAILFAVAFLLVALSMVIENKRLQSSKQQLEDSSKQASASLNGKIAELQGSYEALQKTAAEQEQKLEALTVEADKVPGLEQSVHELSAERDSLSQELETRTQERDGLQSELQAAESEKASLENEIDTLREEKEALIGRAADAAAVQELLYQAVEADKQGSWSELEDLLAQIEPNQDLLSPTALEIYESLKVD